MMAISRPLTMRMRRAFSMRSAIWPALAEKKKYGRMNRPAARLTSTARGRSGEGGIGRQVARGLVGDEDDQRVLQHIVVEGAEELRPEKRREAALGEQFELAAGTRLVFAHIRSACLSGSSCSGRGQKASAAEKNANW